MGFSGSRHCVRATYFGTHKLAEVRNAIETGGANLPFTLLYSPDVNPIEQAFVKPKWLLRASACSVTPVTSSQPVIVQLLALAQTSSGLLNRSSPAGVLRPSGPRY
jgi:transposase